MGKKTTSMPDQSAAMIATAQNSAQASMHNADRMAQLGMAQVGSQIIMAQLMSDNKFQQTFVNFQLGLEALDAKLEIATKDYELRAQEEANRHEETMTELERPAEPEMISTGDFLA